MVNSVYLDFGIAFLIVSAFYFAVFCIFLYRYRRVRLWITYLRGTVPGFFSGMCLAITLGIFSTNADDALLWYRLMIVFFIAGVAFNLAYLTIILYGTLNAFVGAAALFIIGIIYAQMFLSDRFFVSYSPEMQIFYPVVAFRFYINILALGILHTIFDARAIFSIFRRKDTSKISKRKFAFFTFGYSFFFVSLGFFTLLTIIFQDGLWFFWTVLGCFVGLGFLALGLFYANSSVFFIPLHLYLLVVFDGAGKILYKKSFDPIQSTSAQLVAPALVSIAKLIDTSFHQSKLLRLFSLPKRQLLYEWKGDIGAVLIADADSRVFRNCLQLALTQIGLLPDSPDEYDLKIKNIFSFYLQELHERGLNTNGIEKNTE